MRTLFFIKAYSMNLKMLLRRRIVLLLLTIIPALFIAMVRFTSSSNDVYFQLGIANDSELVKAVELNVALVFVSLATIGFLASFLSLNLVQEYEQSNRRLVICGYRPVELVMGNLVVMLTMIIILVLSVWSVIQIFFDPVNSYQLFIGMILMGVTYGSYGLMVGSLVKGNLEGVLSVVILANIDAGWIQNPLYFSGAQNKFIIELLPAYYPSQVSIASAFTDFPIGTTLMTSLGYCMIFLFLAILISYFKLRRNKHNKSTPHVHLATN